MSGILSSRPRLTRRALTGLKERKDETISTPGTGLLDFGKHLKAIDPRRYAKVAHLGRLFHSHYRRLAAHPPALAKGSLCRQNEDQLQLRSFRNLRVGIQEDAT